MKIGSCVTTRVVTFLVFVLLLEWSQVTCKSRRRKRMPDGDNLEENSKVVESTTPEMPKNETSVSKQPTMIVKTNTIFQKESSEEDSNSEDVSREIPEYDEYRNFIEDETTKLPSSTKNYESTTVAGTTISSTSAQIIETTTMHNVQNTQLTISAKPILKLPLTTERTTKTKFPSLKHLYDDNWPRWSSEESKKHEPIAPMESIQSTRTSTHRVIDIKPFLSSDEDMEEEDNTKSSIVHTATSKTLTTKRTQSKSIPTPKHQKIDNGTSTSSEEDMEDEVTNGSLHVPTTTSKTLTMDRIQSANIFAQTGRGFDSGTRMSSEEDEVTNGSLHLPTTTSKTLTMDRIQPKSIFAQTGRGFDSGPLMSSKEDEVNNGSLLVPTTTSKTLTMDRIQSKSIFAQTGRGFDSGTRMSSEEDEVTNGSLHLPTTTSETLTTERIQSTSIFVQRGRGFDSGPHTSSEENMTAITTKPAEFSGEDISILTSTPLSEKETTITTTTSEHNYFTFPTKLPRKKSTRSTRSPFTKIPSKHSTSTRISSTEQSGSVEDSAATETGSSGTWTATKHPKMRTTTTNQPQDMTKDQIKRLMIKFEVASKTKKPTKLRTTTLKSQQNKSNLKKHKYKKKKKNKSFKTTTEVPGGSRQDDITEAPEGITLKTPSNDASEGRRRKGTPTKAAEKRTRKTTTAKAQKGKKWKTRPTEASGGQKTIEVSETKKRKKSKAVSPEGKKRKAKTTEVQEGSKQKGSKSRKKDKIEEER